MSLIVSILLLPFKILFKVLFEIIEQISRHRRRTHSGSWTYPGGAVHDRAQTITERHPIDKLAAPPIQPPKSPSATSPQATANRQTVTKRFKPSKPTYVLAAIAVLLTISFTAAGGFAGFLVILGFLALVVGLWGIAFGAFPAAMIHSRKVGLTVAAIGLLFAVVGGVSAPSPANSHLTKASSVNAAHQSTASRPPATSTPSATSAPTPTVAIDGVTAQTASNAGSTLTQHGFTVLFVDSAGAPVADPTGWTVSAEYPAAGATVPPGSTVTLTVTPPPAPVVQPAPAPVVKPAPPAPAPGGGPTAKCRDGSLSYSAHRQGTCSYHGGVAIWY